MNNTLQLISKYRTPLMGLSILWIMLFHALPHGTHTLFILKIAFGGVDFFLFLSGFGLYYSSLKNTSLSQYYQNRLIRILPPFIIMQLLVSIGMSESLPEIVGKITTYTYWFQPEVYYMYWYVPSILLFYLVFPFYVKWFNKSPYLSTALMILLGFVLTYTCFPNIDTEDDFRFFFTARIPIFFIGVLMGKLSLQKIEKMKLFNTCLVVASVVGIAALYYFLKYLPQYSKGGAGQLLPYIFCAPGILLSLAYLFDKLSVGNILLKSFTYLGARSFELYLVHVPVFGLNIVFGKNIDLNFYLLILIAFVISIIGAHILAWVNNNLIQSIKSKSVEKKDMSIV